MRRCPHLKSLSGPDSLHSWLQQAEARFLLTNQAIAVEKAQPLILHHSGTKNAVFADGILQLSVVYQAV